MKPGSFLSARDVAVVRRLDASGYDMVDGQLLPRDERASLRPLLTWALVVFTLGLVAGVALTLLAQSALGAPASMGKEAPSESGAARAALMVEARTRSVDALDGDVRDLAAAGSAEPTSPSPSSIGSARATLVSRSIVADAASRYGIDPDRFVAILTCESGLRADAIGSAGEVGPAQWLPSTWRSNAPRLGYTADDIRDPAKNVELAAFVMARDGGWRWTCAR